MTTCDGSRRFTRARGAAGREFGS